MIPVISLFHAASAAVCGALFIRTSRRYLAFHDTTTRYFALFYFFLLLFFACAAAPGLVTKDGFLIAAAAAFGYAALFVAVAYLLRVALSIYQHPALGTLYFRAVVAAGLSVLLAILASLDPAVAVPAGTFVFYKVRVPTIIRILVGVVPIAIGAYSAVMFFHGAHALQRSTSSGPLTSGVIRRSYLITIGMTFLLAAGVTNFLVYSFYPTSLFLFVASSLAVIELLILWGGVRLFP